MTTSGPNPGSGPENLSLGQMWSLLVVLEGVYIKRGHINRGFGPDVETFGVNPSQNNPKRPHLAQIQVLGPKPGFGPDVVFVGCFGARLHENTFGLNVSQNKQKFTASGPNPGSGPENLGLADAVVFFGFGWVNINFDGFP